MTQDAGTQDVKPIEPAVKDKGEGEKKRKRREKRSKLDAALSIKRCRHCLSVGLFSKVYTTKGRIRYVHCLACGKTEQVAI